MTEQQNGGHDLLRVLVPILSAMLRGMPDWITDAKRLVTAIRDTPHPELQKGADHIEAAIQAAEKPPE